MRAKEGLRYRAEMTFNHLLPIWAKNSATNYHQINRRKNIISLDRLEKDTNKGALILGSGASLDNFNKIDPSLPIDIFASLTNAMVPLKYNVKPKYICAIDTHEGLKNKAKQIYSFSPQSTLITHPCVNEGVIRNWKGNIGIYRSFQFNSEFFQRILPSIYNQITINIPQSGCVVNQMLAISIFLGYSPIFLLGVDFCYKDNISRFTDFDEKFNPISPPPIVLTNAHIRREDNFVTTDEMLEYKAAFYLLLSIEPEYIYNLSAFSLLYELPQVDIENFNQHYEKLKKYPLKDLKKYFKNMAIKAGYEDYEYDLKQIGGK